MKIGGERKGGSYIGLCEVSAPSKPRREAIYSGSPFRARLALEEHARAGPTEFLRRLLRFVSPRGKVQPLEARDRLWNLVLSLPLIAFLVSTSPASGRRQSEICSCGPPTWRAS